METQELAQAESGAASRRIRPLVRRAVMAAGLILAGIQFVPTGVERNPRSDPNRAFTSMVDVPADIRGMMARACMDCHSNQTRWPWYSKVAPLAWVMAHDVSHARASMNFSDWKVKNAAASAGLLAAAGSAVGAGLMPKASYLMLHPEARLSGAERRRFSDWADAEVGRLIQMAKARRSSGQLSR